MQNIGPEGYQVRPKELAFIAPYVESDERFAGRYVPQTVTIANEREAKFPIIFISNWQLLILTPKGFMGNKFNVSSLPFRDLQAGVLKKVATLPGYETKIYYAGVKTGSGSVTLFSFTKEVDWDDFVGTLEALIISHQA